MGVGTAVDATANAVGTAVDATANAAGTATNEPQRNLFGMITKETCCDAAGESAYCACKDSNCEKAQQDKFDSCVDINDNSKSFFWTDGSDTNQCGFELSKCPATTQRNLWAPQRNLGTAVDATANAAGTATNDSQRNLFGKITQRNLGTAVAATANAVGTAVDATANAAGTAVDATANAVGTATNEPQRNLWAPQRKLRGSSGRNL